MKNLQVIIFYVLAASFFGIASLARVYDRTWFSRGTSALDVGIKEAEVIKLQNSCMACHAGIHVEWEKSAHAKAWTDPVFQEGFALEPKNRCVHCHAPLEEQFSEYQAEHGSKALLNSGVNCIACHVREGNIVSRVASGQAPHGVSASPDFGSPKFCAGCHDFHVLADHSPAIAQSTYSEWQLYKTRGGKKSCVQCHSSPLAHAFPGPLTTDRSGLDVTYKIEGSKLVFNVENKFAGHAIPTGDLFREIVFEVSSDGGRTFKLLKRFGKTYSRTSLGQEKSNLRLVDDTRIEPGSKMELNTRACGAGGKVHFKMTYFRSPAGVRQFSQLPQDQWSRTLLKGIATVRASNCRSQ